MSAVASRLRTPASAAQALARPQTPAPTQRASTSRTGGPPALRLVSAGTGPSPGQLPEAVSRAIREPGVGDNLPSAIQSSLEHTLDISLEGVRVHTDERANTAADSIRARAFTHGLHVFLGSRERPTDLRLMAHEVAHVVQQRGAPVIQTYADGTGDRFEREADRTASTAQHGGKASVVEQTDGAQVQALRIPIVSDAIDWLEDRVWGLLERFAPSLVPIFRQGVLSWLKEKLSQALEAMIDLAARPVRAIGDIVSGVRRHFGNLVTWLQEAAARLARNDCGPITEAADKIYQVFEGLTSPIIDGVKHFATRVKEFFKGLWDRFGAPIWDLLRRIGGAIWEQIERIGRWIWEKTQPVRDWLSRAWRWLKNVIGIGEGEEGQNGILQWFQRKASAAWDWVMARIEPFKRPLMIIAGVLVMLSPAGPIIAIGVAAAGILRGIQWIRQNLRSRTAVAQQQSFLRSTILPAILGAIDRVSGIVRRIANSITGALGRAVEGLNNLVAAVSSIPILSFASGLINWIAGGFRGLLEWAMQGVQGVANWLENGLQSVGGVARRLIDLLEEIARVVRDYFRIAGATFKRLWHMIPACIRDGLVNWLIPMILRHVPFFSELAATPEAWAQTRNEVSNLLVQVFVNFDLLGAMKTVFRLVVRVLRIPVELIGQLLDKAAQAWDLVLAHPMRFIANSFKAMLMGVGRFMRNILSHLWFGITGWLLNAVGERSITVPSGLTDWRGWLNMVLDVLGLSVDHVIDLIDRRFPGAGRRLRQALNFLTGALEWLRIALTEGPRGIWQHLMSRLSDLANVVIEAAVGWVMERVIAIISARLTALAASAGFSAILEAIWAVYQAIRTAIEYLTRILQMLINVFDAVIQIATGVLDPAAQRLESAFRNAMPVMIGFLANYAGLGGIGGRVREIILAVRTRVDNAILALIDGVRAAIQNVLNSIRSGVQAITDWWRMRKRFRSGRTPHSLFFVGTGRSAQLNVESTRKTLRNYIDEDVKPRVASSHPKFGNIALIETAVAEIERIKNDTSYGQAAGNDINTQLTRIANYLDELGDTVPKSIIVTRLHRNLADGSEVGEEVRAEPLTRRPPDDSAGSAPYQTNATWLAVNQRTNKYIRGHLLNHHLYGPGKNANMTPITRSMNTGIMSNLLEEPTKEAVFGQNAIVRYRVKIHYGTHAYPTRRIPQELYLATAVEMESTEIEPAGTGWTDKRVIYRHTEPHHLPPDTDPIGAIPKLHRLAINRPAAGTGDPSAKDALLKLDQIGDHRADLILNHLAIPRSFTSWREVGEVVGRADVISRWEDQKSEADGTTRLVWFRGNTEWRV